MFLQDTLGPEKSMLENKDNIYIYIYIYIVFVFEHRFNSVKKFKCIQVGLLKEDEEAF